MKKQIGFILSVLLVSQFSWARPAKIKEPEVLAICSEDLKSAPLFEILGDMSLFSGPRFTVQYANVTLRSTKTRSLFKGIVTLTKNAPYQYILSAVSTPSVTGALTHSEEVAGFYGVSSGAQMTVIENRDGIAISTFSCVLNTGLLLNP